MTVRLTPHRVRQHHTAEGPQPSQSLDSSVTVPADSPAEPMPNVVTAGISGVPSLTLAVEPTGAGQVPGIDHGVVRRPSGADSRIALREARRQRRRTAWLCTAVVAICLGLTIMVVSLARTRPAPPGVVAPYMFASLSSPVPGGTSLPSDPHPGASASEGGHR